MIHNTIPVSYKIDPAHSNIGFKVRHMMVAKVNGRFDKYEASMEMPKEDFVHAKLDFTAETASINTFDEERDQHLRSADFFNADIHREIGFQSDKIKQVGKNQFSMTGELLMNGVKNKIMLDVEFHGILKDPDSKNRIPLTITGKIDRLKWNMKWNRPLESGGILVSKEVNLIIECEFI